MKIKDYFKRSVLWFFGLSITLIILYAVFLIFIIGPVDNSRENSVQIKDVVKNVWEDGAKDAAFALQEHGHGFYINRGLERGLSLNVLREELLGKEVSLWYARAWPLSGRHITRLEYDGRLIHNEWK